MLCHQIASNRPTWAISLSVWCYTGWQISPGPTYRFWQDKNTHRHTTSAKLIQELLNYLYIFSCWGSAAMGVRRYSMRVQYGPVAYQIKGITRPNGGGLKFGFFIPSNYSIMIKMEEIRWSLFKSRMIFADLIRRFSCCRPRDCRNQRNLSNLLSARVCVCVCGDKEIKRPEIVEVGWTSSCPSYSILTAVSLNKPCIYIDCGNVS